MIPWWAAVASQSVLLLVALFLAWRSLRRRIDFIAGRSNEILWRVARGVDGEVPPSMKARERSHEEWVGGWHPRNRPSEAPDPEEWEAELRKQAASGELDDEVPVYRVDDDLAREIEEIAAGGELDEKRMAAIADKMARSRG